MNEILSKHEKIVLHFSGGKDSVACLLLLREWWDKITVMWCNTGDMFPENEAIVRDFQKILPHFVEIKSDVKAFMKEHGFPSDVVPVFHSTIGRQISGENKIRISNAIECMAFNMWIPIANATKELGATLVIRGQRNYENMKSPINSGHIEAGVEYYFPLESWSQTDVLDYLKLQGFPVPEHFYFEESSMDCMSCTACCSSFADREDYMKRRHPAQHQENKKNIASILSAINAETSYMERMAA